MVTVKIKDNSKQAKLLLEYLKCFSFVEFVANEGNKSSSKEEKQAVIQACRTDKGRNENY